MYDLTQEAEIKHAQEMLNVKMNLILKNGPKNFAYVLTFRVKLLGGSKAWFSLKSKRQWQIQQFFIHLGQKPKPLKKLKMMA